MSCKNNNYLAINKGDSKNLIVTISKDRIIQRGRLTQDILIGPLNGNIVIEIKNSRSIVPGTGFLVLETQANEQQVIEYDSVTELNNQYLFTVNTNINYNFYEGYDVDIDGGRVDISLDTVKFTASNNGVTIIDRTADLVDGGLAGDCIIQLSPLDTDVDVGEYNYDIIWRTNIGSVITLVEGILNIK